jgi:uncharacterized protein (TIGR02996 family)
MGISKHVEEFAGHRLEAYDPAVGILLPLMPRREFRPKDGASDQFWAITLEGDRHTVQSGTVGTEGQTKTKKFPTAQKARDDYLKLVAEKLRAGYAPAIPPLEFEFVQGRSSKFWTIEVRGKGFTVRFGRIGTAGQTQTKEFDDAAEARRAAAKLVAEKTAKGYVEKHAPAGSLLGALYAALAADPDDQVSRAALADFLTEQGQQPTSVAYRVDGNGELGPLEAFLADPAVGLVEALVVGCCFHGYEGGSGEAVQALVRGHDRLTRLRALFLGDITYEEDEISWIAHPDLTGLLTAFPRLEHFRVRGGEGLSLGKFKHEHLKSLAFEASNLSRKVVRAVGASSLPALEHLELWLGTSYYGADTTVADLKDVLAGKPTPALRCLGLRNSEIADDVARAVAQSPILGRLRVLDLSLGNLTDRGAEALLAAPDLARLEKLDIHHHFVSPELVRRLEGLGIQVDASEAEEPEDVDDPEGPHRYVAHME